MSNFVILALVFTTHNAMLFLTLLLVIWTTMGAVFMPRFAPFLLVGMYRLVELWIHPVFVILICAVTATFTTTLIWYLDKYLHKYIDKSKKNSKKKWLSRKMRRWFDRSFSITKDRKVLFLAITAASWSMIPDVFLVEFWRTKMTFRLFITAIFIGKLMTYTFMLLWVDNVVTFFKKCVDFLG